MSREDQLRAASRHLHDFEPGLHDLANYAHGCRVIQRDPDMRALALVVEESARTLARATHALGGAYMRRAQALVPPPGAHDHCLVPCGPDCDLSVEPRAPSGPAE